MYNTLKEIQDALPENDLNRYADKAEGKTAKEIIEMLKEDGIEISLDAAKECVDCLKGIEVVSNEELENAAGGGTCYSKGGGVAAPNGIVHNYVIVTCGNTCPGATWVYDMHGYYFKGSCSWCKHHFGNVPMYCDARWLNHEKLAPGFDQDSLDCCEKMEPFVDGPRDW